MNTATKVFGNTAEKLLAHGSDLKAAALRVGASESESTAVGFRALADLCLDLVEIDQAMPNCDPLSGRVVYSFDADGSKLALDFWKFTFEAA